VVLNNLQVGIGVTKDNMNWDGNLKYALSKQGREGGCPVSVTLYGDMAVSTLPKTNNFVSNSDRITYFSQVIIARKFNKHLSVQVSPSLSYFNNVPAYYNTEGYLEPAMKNAHFACAFMGRYKCTDQMSVFLNYDQPLTQHPMDNPNPNVNFGIEISTIAHTFQIFVGNYQNILPQLNNVLNQNNYTESRYLIGFNITRRWYHDTEK
jgi:hypothetical protein